MAKTVSETEKKIRELAKTVTEQLEAGNLKEVNSSYKTLENMVKRTEDGEINILVREALLGTLKKVSGVVFSYNKAMKGARTVAQSLNDILDA